MKKLFCAALVVGLLFCLGGCRSGGDKTQITSFEKFSLSFTGMSANTDEYEVVKTSTGVTLSYYSGDWNYDDAVNKEDCLVKRTRGKQAQYQRLVQLLNSCEVMRWDGFNKNNKKVLDGYNFSFSAEVNDGESIQARGSNKYPPHYRELKNAVMEMINTGEAE